MQAVADRAVNWTEQGLVPDSVIRHGIRRLLRQRLDELCADDCELGAANLSGFVEMMRASPIAPMPERANEQHYELPPEFFVETLGRHRKYSCCYWPDGIDDLDRAESEALRLTCRRAGIADGMRVLDLGCGWGSASLWIAEHYPNTQVTAVSNSRPQRDFIAGLAAERGLGNVDAILCDMNHFNTDRRFDRVVSVEMFEHMRNYERLFERVAGWLESDGRFFMHIFCHRDTPYEFVDRGPGDWMSRHFFTGGIMPSDDLPLYFQHHLAITEHWRWSGVHYARTSNAWLRNMDDRRERIIPIMERVYGKGQAGKWFMRWRMFFMACAELFDFRNGQEWYVGHYLFERQSGLKS